MPWRNDVNPLLMQWTLNLTKRRVYDSLSLDEQRALLAAFDTLAGGEDGDSRGPAPTHH